MIKYRINLILHIRQQELQEQVLRSTVTIVAVFSLVLLLLSGGWAAFNLYTMNIALKKERSELTRIESEYHKYKTTRMIVDKGDIELLDRLLTGRIYWTKKLAAMAYHLPNRPPNPYWITRFAYENKTLNVRGFGLISPEQEQLVTIDDYLNHLRADTTFSDVFGTCFMNSTGRADDGNVERVMFDYSAENKNGGRGR
jgi:Tfp pilus assembly protein PilN